LKLSLRNRYWELDLQVSRVTSCFEYENLDWVAERKSRKLMGEEECIENSEERELELLAVVEELECFASKV